MSTSWSTPPADASDAELISRTRAGSEDAYAELFTRHRGIALGVARRVAGPDHADDLVAEAFTKVLAALQAGGGPVDAFRGYLLTTVRNLHLNKLRGTRRESLVPDYEDVERHLVIGDGVDDLLDGHAVGRAFASLPERWQTVLWLGTVEGRPNDEIAQMLDLKPNAVAALSFRARDGLREAYLADHLHATDDPGCRRFHDLIPAYVRGNLTRPRQMLVTTHLDGCRRCAGVAAELSLVEAHLAAYLAPLLFVPLLGQAATGAGAGSGVVGWFTNLGALGKAAVLTAAVGPLLTATVVTGAALRGEDTPAGERSSQVATDAPDSPPAAGPVRRPPQVDPAPVARAAHPATVAPLDDVQEREQAPAQDSPAAVAGSGPERPGPASEPPDTTGPEGPEGPPVDPTTGPTSGGILRRLIGRVLRLAGPVVDATTGTAHLLTGVNLLGLPLDPATAEPPDDPWPAP